MHLLHVISILFLTPLICKGPHQSDCNVIPQDVFIERGSSVQIMCFTSCTKECEGVHWKLDYRPYIGHESKRINSSHTVLTLRNFNERLAMLECRRLKTDSVIGGTIIRTYTKPNKVSCILHYKDQKMALPDLLTCKWEDQTNYSQMINYTVRCMSCTPPSEVCTSQETSCTANYYRIMEEISPSGSYNITVRATSDHGVVSSNQYEFQSMKILKIPPPRLLSLTAHSGHVLVKWSILYRISTYLYNCQVRHQKAIGESTGEWVLKNKTLKGISEKGEMIVDGMDSCCNYTFAVRCVLAGALWSNWSQEKTVLTPLIRSDYRPRLWRTLVGSEKDRVRKVCAMWTEAPSACLDALTYTVKHVPYQEGGVQMGSQIECENSICEISSSAHTISLVVLRNGTTFLKESVYFPAVADKSLPRISNITITTLDGSILVGWSAPLQPVNGYVIDYTHNGDQFFYVETKHTSVKLSGLHDKMPYNITVTPLFEDKTGHSTRALQICSSRGAPGALIISSDKAEASSVLVRWSVEPQEVCDGDVVTYVVVYHSENRDSSQLNITVDGTRHEVQLKNLTAETSYTVFVIARALNGWTRSKDLTFRTKRYGEGLTIGLIACIGALIILGFVVGLCCFFQWRKFKEKPVPDPADSSVGKWLFESDEKGSKSVKSFHNPSEILPDKVDAEEAPKPTVSPPEEGGYENLLCQQAKECAASNETPSSNHHNSEETHQMCFSEESVERLCSDSCISNPYRTQSPVENPTPRTAKQLRLVPVKQRDSTASQTVYVTLDMFEQGHSS